MINVSVPMKLKKDTKGYFATFVCFQQDFSIKGLKVVVVQFCMIKVGHFLGVQLHFFITHHDLIMSAFFSDSLQT